MKGEFIGLLGQICLNPKEMVAWVLETFIVLTLLFWLSKLGGLSIVLIRLSLMILLVAALALLVSRYGKGDVTLFLKACLLILC